MAPRGLGDVEERSERRIGMSQRGVDLVAHHRDVVALGQFGDLTELVGAVHQAERIVRIAEQECARPSRESPFDSVEIEAETGAAVICQRHLDDTPSRFGDEVEERRIDRGSDDDAVARTDHQPERFDDDDAHVGRRRDAIGPHRPAPVPLSEGAERPLRPVVRSDVAGVGAFHRRDQGVGDRLRQGVVHLRDEERKHVGRECAPFLAGAFPEIGERIGFNLHASTLPCRPVGGHPEHATGGTPPGCGFSALGPGRAID